LKIVAAQPDAVITGGSGTPGALPYIALSQRGYKGGLYGTHALINPDFVRVGGAAVEGVVCPTGPVIVAEQLPNDYPTKKVALDFRTAFQKVNGTPSTDAFSAYSFDGWLVFVDAAARAKGEPGTPEFRTALRDAIENLKEFVGSQAVFNLSDKDHNGVDQRSQVLVRIENGQWKLVK
jgi:branched-chain amino acid transport system substrate-binding protein